VPHATTPSKIGKYEIIRVIAQSNDNVHEAWERLLELLEIGEAL
jgi:hypothetical protein